MIYTPFLVVQKGMQLPFFNSKSPKVAIVLGGNGYLEMVCPHLSRQGQRKEGSCGEGEEEGKGQEEESRGEGGEEEKGQEEDGGRGQGGEEGKGQEEDGGRRQGGEEGKGQEGSVRYEKVQAALYPITVYVAPPGHPVVTVAFEFDNLEILCFELYNRGNLKEYLAGKNNFLRNFEKEELELAYGSYEEVRRISRIHDDMGFTAGPQEESEGGRHMAV